ncbi:hypothetical protein PoB_005658300 [Plakobranchus ocellatus]|uniref:Uncharacterized protein n=1 Tax=Plakobranchus ocellatus TaxID=259542 RepID=A0AAV4CF10_9GAST|nr:hypothetical protein PoB_005658300 [Plakobranchus ocellatus]
MDKCDLLTLFQPCGPDGQCVYMNGHPICRGETSKELLRKANAWQTVSYSLLVMGAIIFISLGTLTTFSVRYVIVTMDEVLNILDDADPSDAEEEEALRVSGIRARERLEKEVSDVFGEEVSDSVREEPSGEGSN